RMCKSAPSPSWLELNFFSSTLCHHFCVENESHRSGSKLYGNRCRPQRAGRRKSYLEKEPVARRSTDANRSRVGSQRVRHLAATRFLLYLWCDLPGGGRDRVSHVRPFPFQPVAPGAILSARLHPHRNSRPLSIHRNVPTGLHFRWHIPLSARRRGRCG